GWSRKATRPTRVIQATQERYREAVFDRACVLRDGSGSRCARRGAAGPRAHEDACEDACAADATGVARSGHARAGTTVGSGHAGTGALGPGHARTDATG